MGARVSQFFFNESKSFFFFTFVGGRGWVEGRGLELVIFSFN